MRKQKVPYSLFTTLLVCTTILSPANRAFGDDGHTNGSFVQSRSSAPDGPAARSELVEKYCRLENKGRYVRSSLDKELLNKRASEIASTIESDCNKTLGGKINGGPIGRTHDGEWTRPLGGKINGGPIGRSPVSLLGGKINGGPIGRVADDSDLTPLGGKINGGPIGRCHLQLVWELGDKRVYNVTLPDGSRVKKIIRPLPQDARKQQIAQSAEPIGFYEVLGQEGGC